jgi:hypothetical protein
LGRSSSNGSYPSCIRDNSEIVFWLQSTRQRDQARASLFEYMEVFYNRQRRHTAIGYEAPLTFEVLTNAKFKVSTVRG